MAADKKKPIAGITGTYWRLIAVFFILTVLVYVWSGLFSPVALKTYNKLQSIHVAIERRQHQIRFNKKLLVTGELTKEVVYNLRENRNPHK